MGSDDARAPRWADPDPIFDERPDPHAGDGTATHTFGQRTGPPAEGAPVDDWSAAVRCKGCGETLHVTAADTDGRRGYGRRYLQVTCPAGKGKTVIIRVRSAHEWAILDAHPDISNVAPVKAFNRALRHGWAFDGSHHIVTAAVPSEPGEYLDWAAIGGREDSHGILYQVFSRYVHVVVADSLQAAVTSLGGLRPRQGNTRAIYWAPGDRAALVAASPALRHPPSAARVGRPTVVRTRDDWPRVRPGAGIYRIYLLDDTGTREEAVYIGRSTNFQIRPRQHNKYPTEPGSNRPRWGGPGGIAKVELIYAKSDGQPGVWTSTDLDDLERRHIQRFRDRAQLTVLNDYAGGNGRPSQPGHTHTFRWEEVTSGEPTSALE